MANTCLWCGYDTPVGARYCSSCGCTLKDEKAKEGVKRLRALWERSDFTEEEREKWK